MNFLVDTTSLHKSTQMWSILWNIWHKRMLQRIGAPGPRPSSCPKNHPSWLSWDPDQHYLNEKLKSPGKTLKAPTKVHGGKVQPLIIVDLPCSVQFTSLAVNGSMLSWVADKNKLEMSKCGASGFFPLSSFLALMELAHQKSSLANKTQFNWEC